MSDLTYKQDEKLYTGEPGDEERFSHYARKEDIDRSWLTGEPVVALCGKTWVPTRDPEKFPVCPECREIYENVVGMNLPPEERD